MPIRFPKTFPKAGLKTRIAPGLAVLAAGLCLPFPVSVGASATPAETPPAAAAGMSAEAAPISLNSAIDDAAQPAIHAPVDKAEVDARIGALMRRPEMVGLSVAIIENGQITFSKGYGQTERGGPSVTKDTVFRWASVSKGVGAATALILAEEGHFGLMSPVEAFVPSLELSPNLKAMTLEDVLSQRSGMVPNAYDRRIEDGQPAKKIRANLKTVRSVCEPGQCYSYQNVLFDSVAEMTETVTGLPYKAVVAERIFGPLGMNTASLTLEGLARSRSWAKPHNRRGAPYRRVKPTYYRVPAAAGVNSSIVDLARWTQAQMIENSHVLSSGLQAELQLGRINTPRENRNMRRHFHALKDSQYALGWRTYDYEGRRVVGHRGAVEGYRAAVLFDPEINSGVAMLWNSATGRPNGLQLEIFDQIYGNPKRDWMRLSQKW
jgi:beta-lactamase class C